MLERFAAGRSVAGIVSNDTSVHERLLGVYVGGVFLSDNHTAPSRPPAARAV